MSLPLFQFILWLLLKLQSPLTPGDLWQISQWERFSTYLVNCNFFFFFFVFTEAPTYPVISPGPFFHSFTFYPPNLILFFYMLYRLVKEENQSLGFQGRQQALLECGESFPLQVVISTEIQLSAVKNLQCEFFPPLSLYSVLSLHLCNMILCSKPPSLSCLEGSTAPGDSSFWSVWLIFSLSRCTELHRVYLCVCVFVCYHHVPFLTWAH